MKTIYLSFIIAFIFVLPAFANNDDELEKINSKFGLEKVKALIDYAEKKKSEGFYVVAKNLYTESLSILKEEYQSDFVKKLLIDININLSYLNQNYYTDYYSSINELFTALKISKEINDKEKIALSYYLIGLNYRLIEKYENSLEFLDNAISIFNEIKDTNRLISTLNEKANIYYFLKEYKKSEVVREEAYQIALKTQNKGDLYYIKHDKAALLLFEGKYKEAMIIFKEFYYHKILTNIPREVAVSASNIAETFSKMGLIDSAFYYAKIADSIALMYSLTSERIQSLSIIGNLYQDRNDYSNAFKYLTQLINIKDSTFSLENNRQIEELNAIYQNERKQNIINFQKNELYKKTLITLVLVVGILLLLSLGSVLLYSYKQKKKSNDQLKEMNDQIVEKNQKIEQQNKELEVHSLYLEELVSERTKELSSALEEVEKANKLKTEIIANMNHEIRTPLNFIKSSAALIKMDIEDESNPELVETLDYLDSGISRLTRTLELFTDLSSLKSGNYAPHPEVIDLKRICDNFHQIYSKEIEKAQKQIEFTFDYQIEEAYIKADERNTEKIIEFIIDNAVKFTQFGKIWLNLNQKSSEVYQIIIEDTGIGIAEEYKDKIFEPFSQEDMSATRQYDGIGLSLALAYEYALINNFKINFDSAKGKGTRFMLEFPIYDIDVE